MKRLFIFSMTFFTVACALAETKEAIVEQVYQFTENIILDAHPDATRYNINIRQPDPRFSFAACHSPELSVVGNQTQNQLRSRLLIKINCQPRALHLAVDLSVYKPAVVSATALARKTLLNSADINLEEVNILSNTRAMIFDEDAVIGKELKRALRAGSTISPGMLVLPTLIKRGDGVVIVAQKGSLIVRVSGTALASGTMGQQIAVRNSSSERTVKGWVRGPGEVFVPM